MFPRALPVERGRPRPPVPLVANTLMNLHPRSAVTFQVMTRHNPAVLVALCCGYLSFVLRGADAPRSSPFRQTQPLQRSGSDASEPLRSRAAPLGVATPIPATPAPPPREFTAGAAAFPSASSAVVLRPSDVVQITVYQEPDLTTPARLGADGTITFPMLGQLTLGGLTGFQAQELIRKKLQADYLVDPQVSLAIVEYSKQYFTVLGQVLRPGIYETPLERRMTLLEAIGLSGGFTRTAKTSAVAVTRKEKGRERKIKLDARKMARDGNSQGFVVQPGDTIIVDESFF